MKSLFSILIFLVIIPKVGYGQEQPVGHVPRGQRSQFHQYHFLSINPIKPFMGLPNIHYEYQVSRNLGITAFSEVLAFKVIKDFDHPDMVNMVGLSFYPFLGDLVINQGLFVNLNTSYILYFRETEKSNSFANGVQMGCKWLIREVIFVEPKIVVNYVYQEKSVFPGLEVLVGLRI